MAIDTDIAIVIIFLLVNLGLGVRVGRGIKTIKEYAIGGRDFSTATLATTIVATWISGSYFTVIISQIYIEGVWFLPAALGDVLSALIICYIFAPRMKEFFGNLSVAETMGKLFGKHVRMITAISSIAQSIGMTALQIKVFSTVFSYFLGFSSIYATCISSFVVIFYSAWGGIRAVTFTDVIQFCTFGIFIPLFSFFMWKVFADIDVITRAMETNPLLDFSQLSNWQDPRFFPNLAILIWFIIPGLDSTMFQRILMAKSTKQIAQSFKIATIGYALIIAMICAIGMLVLSIDPSLESNNIVMYILDHYSFEGLRGITLIGIIAMVMSTADSWINSGSIIFAHDFCKPLGIKFKDELFLSRLFAVCAGTASVLIVLFNENLFELVLLQSNFYMPIVTVPLILAILGFRSSGRVVLIAMASGAISVILWKIYLESSTGVDSIIPAMIMNLITLISAHYLLGEKGGWVGIKDDSDLKQLRNERKNSKFDLRKHWNQLSDANFSEYCKKQLPKDDMTYIYFGLAVMITNALTTLALNKQIYNNHLTLVTSLQITSFLIGTIFITYKLWQSNIEEKYIGLIWCLSIFIGLACISSFLALISKFSQISVIILILNLTIVSLLMRWKVSLIMIISGTYLSLLSYEFYLGTSEEFVSDIPAMEWNIFYVIFTIIGLSITFFKSRQEREELIEEKNSYLENVMEFKDTELQKAIDLKYEFLRNLEHESHTPITGITSLGQILWESYDLLSETQRRQGIEDIAKSGERLSTLVNNMIDLSKLSSSTYSLNIQKVNLSNLVKERLEICQKLYLNDKELEFVTNIKDGIIVDCDSYYITRVLDNLIVNAIGYSTEGMITITLQKNKDVVEFSIQDEGLSVPASELQDIFGVFVVSSKTHTPAGGRGVGLALCKRSIEVHNGEIWAESNGRKGATFKFTIPE